MADQLNKLNLPETDPPSILDAIRQSDQLLTYNITPETVRPKYGPALGKLDYDPLVVTRQLGKKGTSYSLTNPDSQYLPAKYQSPADRVFNSFGSIMAHSLAEVAQVPLIPFTIWDMVTPYDTGLSEALRDYTTKAVDNTMPVYISEEYAKGDLSFLESLGHAEFYHKEAAPTLGFLIGAFATAGATAKLKLGTKAINFGVNLAKAAKGSKGAQTAVEAGTQFGSKLNKARSFADRVAQQATTTHYEAFAEASMIESELSEFYEPLIKSGEISAEMADNRIAEASKRTYWANAALLSFTNIPGINLLNKSIPALKRGKINQMFSKTPFNRIHDDTGILASEPIRASLGQMAKAAAKKVPTQTAVETFEEGSQSIFSGAYGTAAKTDAFDDGQFNFADDYRALSMNLAAQWGTNEFEKAAALGGLIGGGSALVMGTASYLQDTKKAESIRHNLNNQYSNFGDKFSEIALKDENGKVIYDSNGNPKIDPIELKKVAHKNLQGIADIELVNNLIEEGRVDEAKNITLSRVLAPTIYQYLDDNTGKDLLFTNIENVLKESGYLTEGQELDAEFKQEVDNYYDQMKKAYEYTTKNITPYLDKNLTGLGNSPMFNKYFDYKSTLRNNARPQLKTDLTKEKKKEFKELKAKYLNNLEYAATVAFTSRNRLEAENTDLQRSIDDIINTIDTENSKENPTQAVIKAKQAEKEVLEGKLNDNNSTVNYINEEIEKLFDPKYLTSLLKEYLDVDPNLEYLSKNEIALKEAVARLKQDAKDKGYEFGPATEEERVSAPLSDDLNDVLKNNVYFRGPNNTYHMLSKDKYGNLYFVQIDEQGEIVADSAEMIQYKLIKDKDFLSKYDMLSKEDADKLESIYGIKIRYEALKAAIEEKYQSLSDAIEKGNKRIEDLEAKKEELVAQLNERINQLQDIKDNNKTKQLKYKELQTNIDNIEKAIAQLDSELSQISLDYNGVLEIRNNYKDVHRAITNFMLEYNPPTITRALEEAQPELDTDAFIKEFFNLPEVQEAFKGTSEVLQENLKEATLVSLNQYLDALSLSEKDFKSTIRNLKRQSTQIRKELVKHLALSLSELVADNKFINTDDFLNMIGSDNPALKDLVSNLYKAAMNSSIDLDQYISDRLSENTKFFDGLFNEDLGVFKFVSAYANNESPELLRLSINKIQDVLQYYDSGQGNFKNAIQRYEELRKTLERTKAQLESRKADEPFLKNVVDVIQAFQSIISLANDYQVTLSKYGEIIDEETQLTNKGNLNEQDEGAAEEAYIFRKPTPFTTINGIIEMSNGIPVRDADGRFVLRSNETSEDSQVTNEWLNQQNHLDFTQRYKIQIVNADGLRDIFTETGQTVPDTEADALYSVVVNSKGKPVIFKSKVVYSGIPKVSTTFPTKTTSTLNPIQVLNTVFDIDPTTNTITYQNTVYDLNTKSGFSEAVAKGNSILREQYQVYRRQLQKRALEDVQVVLDPVALSGGVAVTDSSLNAQTGTIEPVTRPASSVSNIESLELPTEPFFTNPVTRQEEPATPGKPILITKLGQRVPIRMEKMGKKKAMAAVKMLAYLGKQNSLRATADYNNAAYPILPNNTSVGLLDMLMVWGRSKKNDKAVNDNEIFIAGPANKRIVTYKQNGSLHIVPLNSLINQETGEINEESPYVQGLLSFLENKMTNVSNKALLSTDFLNEYLEIEDFNYETGEVITGKKHSSYEQYIISKATTSLINENAALPQFINRYVILPSDLPARGKQKPKETVKKQDVETAEEKKKEAASSINSTPPTANTTRQSNPVNFPFSNGVINTELIIDVMDGLTVVADLTFSNNGNIDLNNIKLTGSQSRQFAQAIDTISADLLNDIIKDNYLNMLQDTDESIDFDDLADRMQMTQQKDSPAFLGVNFYVDTPVAPANETPVVTPPEPGVTAPEPTFTPSEPAQEQLLSILPETYLSVPNSDGSFYSNSASSVYKEGASMYSLKQLSETTAIFELDSRSSSVKLAIQYPDKTIDPVSTAINAYNPKATRINTIKPGELELENGKWVVKSKAVIEYLAEGQQPTTSIEVVNINQEEDNSNCGTGGGKANPKKRKKRGNTNRAAE